VLLATGVEGNHATDDPGGIAVLPEFLAVLLVEGDEVTFERADEGEPATRRHGAA